MEPHKPSHDRGGESRLPWNVKLLGWTSLLNDVASEMVVPLLPRFLSDTLGAGSLALGAMEGLADSAASLMKLWVGARSDHVGRRKRFVVFGYALASVTRPLMGLAAAPWQLISLRVADRLGKGVRTSPRDAMIADATAPQDRGRAFGFHRAMDHLGAAVGPALAFLFLWVWPDRLRTLFLLALLPGLAVMGLVVLGLRERPVTKPPAERFTWSLRPLDRSFRIYLLALLVFTLANSSDLFLLQRFQDLRVTTSQQAVLWGLFHVVKSLANLAAGRAADRLGPRPLILLGWVLYALLYSAFAVVSSLATAVLLFMVYGASYAITEPAERTLVANLVGADRRGLAFGWFNLAVGISALPSNLLFGFLYQRFGASVAFGCGAASALVAAGILSLVRSKP